MDFGAIGLMIGFGGIGLAFIIGLIDADFFM